LISFDSLDEEIEIVNNEMRDSILEDQTISSRFYSVDSELYEVKYTRMRKNLMIIQVLWLCMVGLAFFLFILQLLNKTKILN
jgi:hypothetical protein